MALIGEGGMNEAVVPLPDGKSIPIDIRGNRSVQVQGQRLDRDNNNGRTSRLEKTFGDLFDTTKAQAENIKTSSSERNDILKTGVTQRSKLIRLFDAAASARELAASQSEQTQEQRQARDFTRLLEDQQIANMQISEEEAKQILQARELEDIYSRFPNLTEQQNEELLETLNIRNEIKDAAEAERVAELARQAIDAANRSANEQAAEQNEFLQFIQDREIALGIIGEEEAQQILQAREKERILARFPNISEEQRQKLIQLITLDKEQIEAIESTVTKEQEVTAEIGKQVEMQETLNKLKSTGGIAGAGSPLAEARRIEGFESRTPEQQRGAENHFKSFLRTVITGGLTGGAVGFAGAAIQAPVAGLNEIIDNIPGGKQLRQGVQVLQAVSDPVGTGLGYLQEGIKTYVIDPLKETNEGVGTVVDTFLSYKQGGVLGAAVSLTGELTDDFRLSGKEIGDGIKNANGIVPSALERASFNYGNAAETGARISAETLTNSLTTSSADFGNAWAGSTTTAASDLDTSINSGVTTVDTGWSMATDQASTDLAKSINDGTTKLSNAIDSAVSSAERNLRSSSRSGGRDGDGPGGRNNNRVRTNNPGSFGPGSDSHRDVERNRRNKRMATGGIVRSRTDAIIGEAGPEAVIPLSGGRYIPVQLQGGGSQPNNNNITFVVNPQKNIKEEILMTIREFFDNAMAPGGELEHLK